MKACEKCGHPMNDDEIVCPECFHRHEETVRSVKTDNNVLRKGKSTDAESIVSDVADSVLWWGEILSLVAPIYSFVQSIIGAYVSHEYPVWPIVFGIIVSIISFYIIRLTAKIIWGVIMFFVNISTTLKRIELKIEQYGTNQMS